ncbi:MAG: hypothetical protein PHO41_09240 [Eubacteriales bacterium]|nr:hypothetical protein [Eubacteriales bacterium]
MSNARLVEAMTPQTVILLASAERTATISSDDQRVMGKGVRVFINVSAMPGAAVSIVPTITVKDPISGVYTAVLTGAAITGTGHTTLVVYPGVTVANNTIVSAVLSGIFRVTMTCGNANKATYSVAAVQLP